MPPKSTKSIIPVCLPCPFDGQSCQYPCSKLVHAKGVCSMADDDIAQELGVSRSTWWRYRQGSQKPPRSVCSYLHVLMGHLPYPNWTRCFVNRREQRLYVDDINVGLSLSDLRAYWWQLQELQVLRQQHERKRCDQHEAPLPDNVVVFPVL